jgi:hypothetical protein
MSPSRPTKRDDHWKVTIGQRPHTLVAEERPDRKYEVYLRWQETDPVDGKSKPHFCRTGLRVRDDRGRRRRNLEDEARQAAEKAQKIYAAGGSPRDWNKRERVTRIPRTLAEAFAEALPHPEVGHHTGTLYPLRDRHSLDQRRGASFVERYLGGDREWSDIQAGTVSDLWAGMARAYKAGSGPGYRSLVRAVRVLYLVWEHLREQYGADFPAPKRPRRQEQRMRETWEKITGEGIREKRRERKKKLRYDADELRRLFSRLADVREVEVVRGRKHKRTVREVQPLCDPRVRLVVEIGAELRPGQVLRAMRSHLVLAPGLGGYGRGRFLGEKLGRGRKEGETVDLHPELRAYIDHVLTHGYLAELEAARVRGEIHDFPLFPGGKLVNGRIPLARVKKYPHRHLHVTNAIACWRSFEKLAGVQHVQDRSFYGLRRGLTDTANDYSTDDRALDRLTGHQDSDTRKGFYQDRQRDEDRAKAALIRRQMRLDLAGAQAAESDASERTLLDEIGDLPLGEVLGKLDPDARARLLQALSDGTAAGRNEPDSGSKRGGG